MDEIVTDEQSLDISEEEEKAELHLNKMDTIQESEGEISSSKVNRKKSSQSSSFKKKMTRPDSLNKKKKLQIIVPFRIKPHKINQKPSQTSLGSHNIEVKPNSINNNGNLIQFRRDQQSSNFTLAVMKLNEDFDLNIRRNSEILENGDSCDASSSPHTQCNNPNSNMNLFPQKSTKQDFLSTFQKKNEALKRQNSPLLRQLTYYKNKNLSGHILEDTSSEDEEEEKEKKQIQVKNRNMQKSKMLISDLKPKLNNFGPQTQYTKNLFEMRNRSVSSTIQIQEQEQYQTTEEAEVELEEVKDQLTNNFFASRNSLDLEEKMKYIKLKIKKLKLIVNHPKTKSILGMNKENFKTQKYIGESSLQTEEKTTESSPKNNYFGNKKHTGQSKRRTRNHLGQYSQSVNVNYGSFSNILNRNGTQTQQINRPKQHIKDQQQFMVSDFKLHEDKLQSKTEKIQTKRVTKMKSEQTLGEKQLLPYLTPVIKFLLLEQQNFENNQKFQTLQQHHQISSRNTNNHNIQSQGRIGGANDLPQEFQKVESENKKFLKTQQISLRPKIKGNVEDLLQKPTTPYFSSTMSKKPFSNIQARTSTASTTQFKSFQGQDEKKINKNKRIKSKQKI